MSKSYYQKVKGNYFYKYSVIKLKLELKRSQTKVGSKKPTVEQQKEKDKGKWDFSCLMSYTFDSTRV